MPSNSPDQDPSANLSKWKRAKELGSKLFYALAFEDRANRDKFSKWDKVRLAGRIVSGVMAPHNHEPYEPLKGSKQTVEPRSITTPAERSTTIQEVPVGVSTTTTTPNTTTTTPSRTDTIGQTPTTTPPVVSTLPPQPGPELPPTPQA